MEEVDLLLLRVLTSLQVVHDKYNSVTFGYWKAPNNLVYKYTWSQLFEYIPDYSLASFIFHSI